MTSTSSRSGSSAAERKEWDGKRTTNLNNPYNNPCLKEQNMSFDCLERNMYKYENCQLQFENYKACRKFSDSVYHERRRWEYIYPYIPNPEERDTIRAEYFSSFK